MDVRMVSSRLRGARHNARGNYCVSERTPNLMARQILRELRTPWLAGPVAHPNVMKYAGKPQPFFKFNWSLWGRLGHSLGSEWGPFRCGGAARKCRFDFLSFARAYGSALPGISARLGSVRTHSSFPLHYASHLVADSTPSAHPFLICSSVSVLITCHRGS
jgi:hypothetical protein